MSSSTRLPGYALEERCVIQFIDASIFLEIEPGQKRLHECKVYLRKSRDGEIEAITTNFIVDTVSILMDDAGCDPAKIRRFNLGLLSRKDLAYTIPR